MEIKDYVPQENESPPSFIKFTRPLAVDEESAFFFNYLEKCLTHIQVPGADLRVGTDGHPHLVDNPNVALECYELQGRRIQKGFERWWNIRHKQMLLQPGAETTAEAMYIVTDRTGMMVERAVLLSELQPIQSCYFDNSAVLRLLMNFSARKYRSPAINVAAHDILMEMRNADPPKSLHDMDQFVPMTRREYDAEMAKQPSE